MAEWTLVLPNNTTLGLTENNGLAVVGISGAGMPPIENIYTPYGLGDGALWQRAAVQPRLVTVLIDAVGTSWVGLHNLRAKLIEAVNPHEATPITLQYSAGGSKPTLYLDCYYDSGLEGGVTEGFMEKGMALRLLAVDPYWHVDTETTGDLAHIQTVTDVSGIVKRDTDGTITNLDTGVHDIAGGGANMSVRALAMLGTDIEAYGVFDQAGTVPVDVTGIAEWSGAAWSDPAPPWDTLWNYTGDGQMWGPAIEALGAVYAAGMYTTVAGFGFVVWKYDGTTWTAYETEDARPTALAFSPSGVIWAVLEDLSSNLVDIRYYDVPTLAWVSVSTPAAAASFTGTALAFSQNGMLYLGGTFTAVDGVTAKNVAMYNPATDTWSALDVGLNNSVYALIVDPSGLVYAGGIFTANGDASTAMERMAQWNGVQWQAMGDGLSDDVRALAIDSVGLLAVGDFTASGTRDLPSQSAYWHDNLWLDSGMGYASAHMDDGIWALYSASSVTYAGGFFTGTWVGAGTTSVTNAGTARAYPVITLTGPGALYYVINWTTNQWLYFDLTLLQGEILTIDLRPGIKTITSSFRGNCLPFLVSGNLIDWHLAPGANDIGVWIDDATADADISFLPRYWSSDGKST